MLKSELRKYIRSVKKKYTSEELITMSKFLCRQILSSTIWKESSVVLLYYALPDEVDTKLLLDDAIFNQKTVLLPVVQGNELILRRYSGYTREGAFGIPEPIGEVFSDYRSIQLVIVPGMAYDVKCHRLGRGKGYYDRFLKQIEAFKIGLCFPFQMCDEIPIEPHDIEMDALVSKIECL